MIPRIIKFGVPGGAIGCAQALHLGESREVAQEQHAKELARRLGKLRAREGGYHIFKSDGDARGIIENKPLRKTNVGVAET